MGFPTHDLHSLVMKLDNSFILKEKGGET